MSELRPYQIDVYVDGVQVWRVIEASASGGWYLQLNEDGIAETKIGKVELRAYSKEGVFLGLVDYGSARNG